MTLGTLLTACFVFALLVFIVCHAAAWRLFDSLIDYQYLVAREAWERDGRPEGGEITRRKRTGFWDLGGRKDNEPLLMKWVAARPEWMVGDLRAVTMYRRLKRLYVTGRTAFWVAVASLIGGAFASGAW